MKYSNGIEGKKKETSLDKSIISFLESGFAISRKLLSRGDRLLEKKNQNF